MHAKTRTTGHFRSWKHLRCLQHLSDGYVSRFGATISPSVVLHTPPRLGHGLTRCHIHAVLQAFRANVSKDSDVSPLIVASNLPMRRKFPEQYPPPCHRHLPTTFSDRYNLATINHAILPPSLHPWPTPSISISIYNVPVQYLSARPLSDGRMF